MLLLFPFFSIKNIYHFSDSGLSQIFSAEKDDFYRLLSDGNIKWRSILYAINRQLINKSPHQTLNLMGRLIFRIGCLLDNHLLASDEHDARGWAYYLLAKQIVAWSDGRGRTIRCNLLDTGG